MAEEIYYPSTFALKCLCGWRMNIRTNEADKRVVCWYCKAHTVHVHLGYGAGNYRITIKNNETGREVQVKPIHVDQMRPSR